MNDEQSIGCGWYRPEQWQLLYAASVDKEVLEKTYDEWERMAEKALADMKAHGINVHKVDVDVEELIAWCKAEGKVLDGSARSQFVAWKVQEAVNE